jgi:hypothetical protein
MNGYTDMMFIQVSTSFGPKMEYHLIVIILQQRMGYRRKRFEQVRGPYGQCDSFFKTEISNGIVNDKYRHLVL